MKRFFSNALFSVAIFSASATVMADPQAVAELQKRLNAVTQYSSDFEQVVRSSKGKEIQRGSGKFYVQRPNLFRMETKSPQENIIVSDGKTLWFYDPFVEQVTANWVKDAVNNTPFVLLTSNDKNYWQQYEVKQTSDNFTLLPKSKKSGIKQFDIRIDENGLMRGFSTVERDGQSNLYLLRNISNAHLDAALFQFTLPKGAEFDDQRTK